LTDYVREDLLKLKLNREREEQYFYGSLTAGWQNKDWIYLAQDSGKL